MLPNISKFVKYVGHHILKKEITLDIFKVMHVRPLQTFQSTKMQNPSVVTSAVKFSKNEVILGNIVKIFMESNLKIGFMLAILVAKNLHLDQVSVDITTFGTNMPILKMEMVQLVDIAEKNFRLHKIGGHICKGFMVLLQKLKNIITLQFATARKIEKKICKNIIEVDIEY